MSLREAMWQINRRLLRPGLEVRRGPAKVLLALLAAAFLLMLASKSSSTMQLQFPEDFQRNATSTRVILTWTNFFGSPMTHEHYIVENGCANLNCRMTTDRRELGSAHAVVFHTMADFDEDDLPPRRWPAQRYVMLAHETAENSHHIRDFNTPRLRGFFNWTMTMRLDSDVPYPYAVIARDAAAAEPGALEEAGRAFDGKSRPIVWFVSNCKTASKREKIVALLKRELAVDVFGACGRESGCPRGPTGKGCEAELLNRKYFFHLALENSVCRDYITEKYQARYMHYSIPIVLSRAIANGTTAPRSVIAIDDFASVRELAAHLRRLMRDRSAWAEHFRWKLEGWRDTGVVKGYRIGFCGLCQRLWEDERKGRRESIYWDMNDFWFKGFRCRGSDLAVAQIRAYLRLKHPDITDQAVLDFIQEGNKY